MALKGLNVVVGLVLYCVYCISRSSMIITNDRDGLRRRL